MSETNTQDARQDGTEPLTRTHKLLLHVEIVVAILRGGGAAEQRVREVLDVIDETEMLDELATARANEFAIARSEGQQEIEAAYIEGYEDGLQDVQEIIDRLPEVPNIVVPEHRRAARTAVAQPETET